MARTIDEFYAKNRAAWRQWLLSNHQQQQAVWLILDKGKHRKISWGDVVQEALCFGWIDSTAGSVSATQSKLYVTKRKPTSAWSRINKDHVEKLIATGQMQPAGMAAVQAAKQNGAWDALNKSDNLEKPPELVAALAKNKLAAQNFEQFPDSAKRGILAWLYSPKRPETLKKRVAETVALAAQNIRAHQ